MSPGLVVERCRALDIDAVVICDHDSADGLPEAREAGRRHGVLVIPAVEYATDCGDVIGLFANALADDNGIAAVLAHIRRQGGLAVLPHPFRGHRLDRLPLEQIDLIEVYNARCTSRENELAAMLAVRHGKATIAGADAHVPGELELVSNRFEGVARARPEDWTAPELRRLFLEAPRSFQCESSSPGAVCLSQLIKGIKQRRPRILTQSLQQFGRSLVRRHLWRFVRSQS